MTQIQAARGFPLSERGGWSEDEEGERGKTKKRERGWKDQSKWKWQQNGDGGGELPEGKPEPCSHLNAGELSAQKGSFKFLHRKVVISGKDFSPKDAVPFRLRDVGTLRHVRIVEPVKYVELQCYNFKFDKLCDLLSVTCICWFVWKSRCGLVEK